MSSWPSYFFNLPKINYILTTYFLKFSNMFPTYMLYQSSCSSITFTAIHEGETFQCQICTRCLADADLETYRQKHVCWSSWVESHNKTHNLLWISTLCWTRAILLLNSAPRWLQIGTGFALFTVITNGALFWFAHKVTDLADRSQIGINIIQIRCIADLFYLLFFKIDTCISYVSKPRF